MYNKAQMYGYCSVNTAVQMAGHSVHEVKMDLTVIEGASSGPG